MKKILVFPATALSIPSSLNLCRQLGISIVGASSITQSDMLSVFDDYFYLPFVNVSHFDSEFFSLIASAGITHVFSENEAVWRHLETIVNDPILCLDIVLLGPSPFEASWDKYSISYEWANEFLMHCETSNFSLCGHNPNPPLLKDQYAYLHWHYCEIPGQSDTSKLSALSNLFRILPEGHIIEIGCLYGRSAYALARLAALYDIGNLVCIDPWEFSKIKPQGEDAEMLTNQMKYIDCEKIFMIFKANACSLSNIAYIKSTSIEAAPIVTDCMKRKTISSSLNQDLIFSPTISLLHIDGNHAFDYALSDVQTYLPHLCPGGWLLLDDYEWSFGDGPKRVGNMLISSGQFSHHFVISDTLYLCKK